MAKRTWDPRRAIRAGAILALLTVALFLERQFHWTAVLDSARIEALLREAGPLAPLVFVLVMAATVVSPVPTFPLDLLAGRFFGPFVGTFYAVTGATIGALVSFTLARWLGRDLVARFLGGHIHFCRRCSDRLLTKVVFLARLVPAVSFDMVSYGSGLTKMSGWKFGVATFAGMIPLTFLYATVGPMLSIGRTVVWLGGAVAVALLFFLPRWIERYDLFGMKRLFEHADSGDGVDASARPVTRQNGIASDLR